MGGKHDRLGPLTIEKKKSCVKCFQKFRFYNFEM